MTPSVPKEPTKSFGQVVAGDVLHDLAAAAHHGAVGQ